MADPETAPEKLDDSAAGGQDGEQQRRQGRYKSKRAQPKPQKKATVERKSADDSVGGGASPFGNFHQYYKFNPALERLQHFPADLPAVVARDRRVEFLDIGCNEGDISFALAELLLQGKGAAGAAAVTSVRGLGVDIDPVLIQRAAQKSPPPAPRASFAFEQCSVMDDAVFASLQQRAPAGGGGFDLVAVLSVTMWLHLHHGDAGLQRFLRRAAALARHLVIEPQPWKCYLTAVKRAHKAGFHEPPAFKALAWRQDVDSKIIDFLRDECKMHVVQVLGETKWSRTVVWLAREMPDRAAVAAATSAPAEPEHKAAEATAAAASDRKAGETAAAPAPPAASLAASAPAAPERKAVADVAPARSDAALAATLDRSGRRRWVPWLAVAGFAVCGSALIALKGRKR